MPAKTIVFNEAVRDKIRSGVEKLEVDLRRLGCRLAPSACRLAAIVFVTARSAAKGPLLRPIRAREALNSVRKLAFASR